MCRLFGQISPSPRSALDLLVDSDRSLLEQSGAKKSCLQKDGWGLGWYDAAGKPQHVRSNQPIYREVKQLRTAAKAAVSKIVIGHVRAASNPLKLPRERLYNVANNQPFVDGQWLFGHNGTLNIPKETMEALGSRRKRLKGENDSEIWFQHLLKHLDKAPTFHEAAQNALVELWHLWFASKKKYPGVQAPYTSLNVVASDGEALYGLCHAAYKGMAIQAACTPEQPWQLMSWAQRPDRLVVGSEGFDNGKWTMFNAPETLTARLRGGRVTVERAQLTGLTQVPLKVRETVS
jgi:predicted glutamine amidotransferase